MKDDKHLIVDYVSKVFKSKDVEFKVLDSISMNIERGSFITIVGPSGCGKSTLIRIIAGLESPTGGVIRIGTEIVTEPGPDRGMVFQSYSLFPWLTVEKNISFGLDLTDMKEAEKKKKVLDYLEIIGLQEFKDHYPSQLSGGMKQRVAIARALINEPRILLMDEPFGALDAQTKYVMQESLVQVWQKTKTTVVFITHDVDEAIYLGDIVYVMKARPGRIKLKKVIDFERPRSYEVKTSKEFSDVRNEILEMIREENIMSF